MSDRAIVPCAGCTACCRRERVVLSPEDDPGAYQTEAALGPDVTPGDLMLAHKSNGDCVYLGFVGAGGTLREGCTIWDRAPQVCRRFDCRQWLSRRGTGDPVPDELSPDDISGEVEQAASLRLDDLADEAQPTGDYCPQCRGPCRRRPRHSDGMNI